MMDETAFFDADSTFLNDLDEEDLRELGESVQVINIECKPAATQVAEVDEDCVNSPAAGKAFQTGKTESGTADAQIKAKNVTMDTTSNVSEVCQNAVLTL